MKRLLVTATMLGLVVTATPAMAESSGGTAHITGSVPASITFTFTTPSTVAVGALPTGATTAPVDFGYDVSSNAAWNMDLTVTFPGGFNVNGRWWTPIPDNGAGVNFVSGTPHTNWRTQASAGTFSYSDRFAVTNNSASPGSFDVALTYLATTV